MLLVSGGAPYLHISISFRLAKRFIMTVSLPLSRASRERHYPWRSGGAMHETALRAVTLIFFLVAIYFSHSLENF